MQTHLTDSLADTPLGSEAAAILGACVHCGFCNATCPTYQILGSELDAPRGRIYLMKMALEGSEVSDRTQRHLDRCLSCRACETTCPSGVRYGRLLDIGRSVVEARVPRRRRERWLRWTLRKLLPYPNRFGPLLATARLLRPLLPAPWQGKLPSHRPTSAWPARDHRRRMLLLPGCVQPVLAPTIDASAARILDALGIRLVRAAGSGCCGALSYHLTAREEALRFIRANIDAFWPEIEKGAEAIVSTASGCGIMVKEYGQVLRNDPDYAEKAERISAMTRDIGEILAAEELAPLRRGGIQKIAFQAPCTLQHGQRLDGLIEGLLTRLGFELTPVADAHLCCGSAGTYSILQGELAEQLRTRKLAALAAGAPECIVTANIGCLLHLQAASNLPVRHWLELLEVDAPTVSG